MGEQSTQKIWQHAHDAGATAFMIKEKNDSEAYKLRLLSTRAGDRMRDEYCYPDYRVRLLEVARDANANEQGAKNFFGMSGDTRRCLSISLARSVLLFACVGARGPGCVVLDEDQA